MYKKVLGYDLLIINLINNLDLKLVNSIDRGLNFPTDTNLDPQGVEEAVHVDQEKSVEDGIRQLEVD